MLLFKLVVLCNSTTGLPTQDKLRLPFDRAPTLMPPGPVPVITKFAKSKVPPVLTVTNTKPAPVITPLRLLVAVEPIKPPELVTVRFFQFAAARLRVVV